MTVSARAPHSFFLLTTELTLLNFRIKFLKFLQLMVKKRKNSRKSTVKSVVSLVNKNLEDNNETATESS